MLSLSGKMLNSRIEVAVGFLGDHDHCVKLNVNLITALEQGWIRISLHYSLTKRSKISCYTSNESYNYPLLIYISGPVQIGKYVK